MENQDDEMLVQQMKYTPRRTRRRAGENSEADAKKPEENSKASTNTSEENPQRESSESESEGRNSRSDRATIFDDSKKMIIIGGAVVGVIIVIVLLLVGANIYSKHQEEKRLKHADDLLVDEEEIQTFYYSSDEYERLREAGYTGMEIEEFELQEMDVDDLIKDAETRRKAKIEEEIVPYFDAASDEFKELYNSTWISGNDYTINGSPDDWNHWSEVLNVDYRKLPKKGLQCFIQFKLADTGESGFMYMDPLRFDQLPEEGNIVLNISFVEMPDGTRLINKIKEVIPE